MIRFSKFVWLYLCISSLVILPGILSLVSSGLKPSIDFTGGTLIELRVPPELSRDSLESFANELSLPLVNVQHSQSESYLLRIKPEGSSKVGEYVRLLQSKVSGQITLLRNESVGPVLGRELLQKALIAAVLAITCILLYVAYAFKNVTFGVSAVVALLHDLLVVIGLFSIFGRVWAVEVDTLFITAVLTTMSFSVHDTIVVFDRIREMRKKGVRGEVNEIADMALTQTMSRSLANSVTIILMLLSLVMLGGESIRWFAVALLIGTISGTYSSPFVAVPTYLFLQRIRKK